MAFYDQLNSFFTGESEEERRRREEEERLRIERETPVKQTIETDPITGAQTVKIESSAYNLSSANPLTPTVTGGPVQPVRPEDLMPPQEQYVGTPGIMPASTSATTATQMPPTGTNQPRPMAMEEMERRYQEYLQGREPVRSDTGQVMGYETPQEMVQGAATNAPVQRPPEAPVAPAEPTMTPAVATAPQQPPAGPAVPGAQPTQAQPTTPTPPVGPTIQTDDQGNQLITTADGRTFTVGPDGRPLPFGGVAVEQMPQARAFLAAQNDVRKLAEIADDRTGQFTDFEKRLAARQLMENLTYQRAEVEGQGLAKEAVQSGNTRLLDKILKDRSEGITASGIAKAFLYSAIGFESGARDVVNKMGVGAKWQQDRDKDGNPVLVRVAADGLPLEAIDSQGNQLTTDQLVGFGGGAAGKFKPEIGGAYVKTDSQGNITMRGVRVTETLPNGTTRTMIESGGKRYDINAGWQPESISTAAQRAEVTKAVELRYTGPIAYTKAGADFAGKFNAENGTNIGYATQTPGAPLVDLNTGQRIVPDSNGRITATTRTGQAVTAGGGGAVTGTGTGGMTPAQITTQTAVSKAAQEQFVQKTVPSIIEEGTGGASVASIRSQQIDIIKNNPSILGIYQGTGTEYDRARNVITKLISGAYGQENSGEFYKDLKATGLRENERAALEQFGNLNMEINSKTLKANTGGGNISNAEQKINKDANLSNIAEQTPLASMQGLYRSQFVGNLNNYKQWYMTNNEATLNTDAKFAAAWQKEQAKMGRAYQGIMEARAEYLKQFIPPKNPTAQQLDIFRDRVFKAFEMYPSPTFDATTGKWNYGTANAERAAAKRLLGQ